nr:TIGR01459 family HAD-type hydrolase [uncultured Dongia sp.]
MTAEMINGIREIADQFDAVLLDQWGALHEGQAVFPAARDCVAKLRAGGKKILVLSNSGKRSSENLRRLQDLGLPADEYDGVLSSGEVAWRGLRDPAHAAFPALGKRCYLITRGRDLSIVAGLSVDIASNPSVADFILLAGLDDDKSAPEAWQAIFATAISRQLPMLCANPDLTMFGAGGLMPAPGALAAHYAAMGGRVIYIGKPHPPIFVAAMSQLGNPAPKRVVVIGDSLDHDILGGCQAGMRTVLIAAGVHAPILRNARDVPKAVRDLAAGPANEPDWIIDHLAW